MGTLLHLESFDDRSRGATQQATQPDEPPVGYEQGYAAGLAAAEVQFASEQAQLTQGLLASVSDGVLSYQETQAQLVAAVGPLLETMIETLLPAALAPALHAHLRDLVHQALLADAAAPITLKVSPDQCAAVEAAVAELDAAVLQIVPDPTLSDAAAWVVTPRGETALDLNAALEATAAHIAALQETTQSMAEAS